MDRVIKFRGKDKVFGFWAKGYLSKRQFGCFPTETIIVNEKGTGYNTIHLKTVGEFTGAYDIDGNEIFEGDIIQNQESPEDIYEVAMIDGAFRVLEKGYKGEDLYWTLGQAPFKVIGNIHDNPELLKGCK